MAKKLFLIFLLFVTTLFSEADNNQTELDFAKIEYIEEKISKIDDELKNNLWLIGYQNYIIYQDLIDELQVVDKKVKKLSKKRDKKSKTLYKEQVIEQDKLEKQIGLLYEYKNSPFVKIVKPDELKPKPSITNPFLMLSAFSYKKEINEDRQKYKERLESLDRLIVSLKEKEELLQNLYGLSKSGRAKERLFIIEQDILAFNSAHDLAETTFSVYSNKVDSAIIEVSKEIAEQTKRALNIAIFIAIVIAISIVFKLISKRYIKDNERFYMANKAINFMNFTIIIIFLLFSYIENVAYFVTILGFASAGIAIAMKDWFMSILGWMVIVFGGSFHVGDRVKVQRDGLTYVGDIIDISLLRMTILEDITLTTYVQNRRSGRVIFIPNNYIFTALLANYTHGTLKTVWDGLDFTITFESNHQKALYIISEITKKYSKGYTDIARRNLNKLRSQYSLKNTNVEPRIFSFLEPHGLTISTWYMTNSYATLGLRSKISSEIIDAIKKEDDIKIAYPTQTIDIRDANKQIFQELNE